MGTTITKEKSTSMGFSIENLKLRSISTAQNMKFSIDDFFSKY